LKTSKDDAVVVATGVGMWSTWKGPPDPGRLSKLCASRAAYPRQFARRCGFTPWRTPPLRGGHRREQGCRNLDKPRLVPGQRRTSCRIRSGGRRRTGRRIGRTRRSCDRRVLCGAEVPCARLLNRPWGFAGGAGNCVAGELAHSTSRVSTACLCRTPGSRPDHHANPHVWAFGLMASRHPPSAMSGRRSGRAGSACSKTSCSSSLAALGAILIDDVLNALRPLVHQRGVEYRVRRRCRCSTLMPPLPARLLANGL
jgi:hypothetical protein